MTISYSAKVGTASKVGAFFKLLFVWKGSVYKLVWFDFVIYLGFYFVISLLYRFGLNQEQMRDFERLCRFCDAYSSLIPLTFVLAFYVGHVLSRWWEQWSAIPWPDSVAFKVNAYVRGSDDQSRLIRRNVTRYACLAIIDSLCMISSKVKKRFPTWEHFVDAGLLTEAELLAIRRAQLRSEYMNYTYWMPVAWASSLLVQAHEQGYIDTAKYVVDMNDELGRLRTACGVIICYDWISLPLVYTQVVTLAVYSFFGVTLLGRQWLDPAHAGNKDDYDFVFPVFTSLQFIFYVGWMKVAEALLNPYGEDDEDFDTNWMVDRHLQLSYLMVDEVGQYPPQPEKDPFWEVGCPTELPYTLASIPFRGELTETNAEGLKIPLEEQRPVYPEDREAAKKFGGSTMMLNQLVSSVVNWAQSPLDNEAPCEEQPASSSFDPSSASSNVLEVGSNKSGRSCSTASAPSPSQLRASRSLQRNSSLRKSFRPFSGSSQRPSPLSREPSQMSSLGYASRKASSVANGNGPHPAQEGKATEVPSITIEVSPPPPNAPLPPPPSPLSRSSSQLSNLSCCSRKVSSVGSTSLHTVQEESDADGSSSSSPSPSVVRGGGNAGGDDHGEQEGTEEAEEAGEEKREEEKESTE